MGLESNIPRSQGERQPHERLIGPAGTPLPPSGGIAGGGALSGLLAGGAMWLALMCWTASLGQGFWTPLQLVGGSFLGLRAVLGGAGAGVLGATLTALTSAFWGIVFAALVSPEMRPGQAFWAGLVYGVSVWAVMTWIGLPIFDRTFEARIGLIEGPWFVCHLVFGAALLYTPVLRRRRAEEQARRLERLRAAQAETLSPLRS